MDLDYFQFVKRKDWLDDVVNLRGCERVGKVIGMIAATNGDGLEKLW